MTIINALFFFILLLPIFRHQLLSLIIIGLCLLIMIAIEFVFLEFNIFLKYYDLISVILISLIGNFFRALLDSIEKYLFE